MKKKLIIMLSACMTMATSCGNSSKVDTTLINGDWLIEAAMGVSTETAENEAFISFDGKGGVNGNASVNTFFGSYVYDGETFRLDNIGMTRMFGASMDVEDAVTEAINTAASIDIDGDKAVVRNEAGDTVMTLARK